MLTFFRQAAFTGDDKLIVAMRYLHLFFYCADTYAPLKVPIRNIRL